MAQDVQQDDATSSKISRLKVMAVIAVFLLMTVSVVLLAWNNHNPYLQTEPRSMSGKYSHTDRMGLADFTVV